MSSLWQLILPKPMFNLIGNPSFELNTTTWLPLNGGVLTRVNTRQAIGVWSLQVQPATNTTNSGIQTTVTIPASGVYTASAYIWAPTGVPLRIAIGSWSTTVTGLGRWLRVSVTTGTIQNPVVLQIGLNGSFPSPASFWVDAVQVEEFNISDYCDGDQNNCRWTGSVHGSTSQRLSESLNGTHQLFSEYGFYIEQTQGVGAAPLTIHGSVYGNLDGGSYERTAVQPRSFGLRGRLVANSLPELLERRAQLLHDLRVGNEDGRIQLRYNGLRPMRITAVCEAGLEFGERQGFSEQLALRFIAHHPYWISETQHSLPASSVVNLAEALVHERGADGTWRALTGLSGGSILALAYGPDGRLYAGGSFSGGLRVWNTTAWELVGGSVNGSVHALLWVGTTLYFGGSFTLVGGVPAANIATWNGTAVTALGSGRNGVVRALALDTRQSNLVYVGGDFTGNLATWNGTTWQTLSSLNGSVRALAANARGVFVGGSFTSPTSFVGYWNDNSLIAMGSGVDSVVHALLLLSDGSLLVGGEFGFAGGVLLDNLGRWTGSQWERIPSGPGNAVRALARDGSMWWFANDGTLLTGTRSVAVRAGLLSAASILTALALAAGRVAVGRDVSRSVPAANPTTIVYEGSVPLSPILYVEVNSSNQRLMSLTNITTGSILPLDILLNDETVTIDLERLQVISSRRGDISALLRTTAGTWRLKPGENRVAVLADVLMNVYILYVSRDKSIDQSVYV